MRNVYFCQFSNLLEDNVYLPYSAGIIVSYLKSNEAIKESYYFKILFLKKGIANLLDEVKDPRYVFMSVYMWNFQYSMTIAKAIKIKYPDTKIVLGGHHVPYHEYDFLNLYPYIDILVHGEGEKVCEELLLGKSLYEINNITFKKGNDSISTKRYYNNCDLNSIPSPYLTDIFKDILNLPYKFTTTLETNRGCPYGCAYCDWGSTMTSEKKLRSFDRNRVMQEIEWIGKNKIEFVFGADSNFGIFKTDMDYVNKIVETKKKYGYPYKFRVCFAKNTDDFIFDINKILNNEGLSKGATLSFQSLNTDSMKAVGRKNVSISTFKKLLVKYKNENIPTYTEMILGLPMETYDSFANGLCTLIDNGQHDSIVVYYCQVYPNNEMNSTTYRKRYSLRTVKIPMFPTHTTIKHSRDIDEEEIIIGTKTMPTKDWIDTAIFSWGIQVFHCLGLCQFIARFLNKKHNIKYRDIYSSILEFARINPESIIGAEYEKIKSKYIDVIKGNGFVYKADGYGDLNWTFEEGSFLSFILNIELFYSNIFDCLYNRFCAYVNKQELIDLVCFNRFIIKVPSKIKCLYINSSATIEALKFYGVKNYKQYNAIINKNSIKDYTSLNEYAVQIVWYGRKGGSLLYNPTDFIGDK